MKALRILVVEDDTMIGGLLVETPEGLGHAVCALENNVANAVAAASRCRPDLMIVEVGLGEASGIAAVKEILQSGFVPHVFVTGDTMRAVPLGPETSSFKSPSACRTWSLRFSRRSRRLLFATRSQRGRENSG